MPLSSLRRFLRRHWALLVWGVGFIAFRNLSLLAGGDPGAIDPLVAWRAEAPNPALSRLFVVRITGDDFRDHFNHTNPLHPDRVIELIAEIQRGNPAVIAVDILTGEPAYEALITKLQRESPIVWGRAAADLGGAASLPEGETPVLSSGTPPIGGAVMPTAWNVGLLNHLVDDDGRFRRSLRIVSWNGQPVSSLHWATVRAFCERDELRSLPECRRIPECTQPNETCTSPHWIPFSKPAAPGITAGSVLKLSQSPGWQPQSLFEGKIVLVGGAFEEARDNHDTPIGTMPGVDVWAQAIAGELNGVLTRQRNRYFLAACEVLALGMLVVLQFRIKERVGSGALVAIVFAGVILFSCVLSLIAYDSAWMFLGFVPLLVGVFLDAWQDLVLQRADAKGLAAAEKQPSSRL